MSNTILPQLTPRVQAWRDQGRDEVARGRRIFARRHDGDGPLLLFLHGFPSSSYDWRLVLEELGEPRSLAFDCLGFGLSEKPRGKDYSLFWQADIAEELVGSDAGPVVVVGHDMGTSVATELLARDIDGTLGFELAGMLLFNGSIVAELASLTLAQKILLSRAGPVAAKLSTRRFFVQQFGGVFSDAHPLSAAEAEDQWALLEAGGGRGLGHHQVAYYNERITNAERWHGALGSWPGELHYVWGLLDPVATTRMFEAVKRIRPQAPAVELPGTRPLPPARGPAADRGGRRAACNQRHAVSNRREPARAAGIGCGAHGRGCVFRRSDRGAWRRDSRHRAPEPVLQRPRPDHPPGLAGGALPAPLRAVRRCRPDRRLRGRGDRPLPLRLRLRRRHRGAHMGADRRPAAARLPARRGALHRALDRDRRHRPRRRSARRARSCRRASARRRRSASSCSRSS